LKKVPALTGGDAQRLLRFVAEAESLGGDEPFTGELLTELGKLVHADWVTYCELDRVRRRTRLNIARAGDDEDDYEAWEQVFWSIVMEEHPVCLQHQRGEFRALKLSDFATTRELHNLRVYDVWFKPLGVERELSVPIPSPLWHTKTFLFDRTGARDFTERDRLVLDLLQPHFARLWHAARTRRLLNATLESLDRASEREPHGLILLTGEKLIEFASPPARRLLREFFSTHSGARLPAAVARWLNAGATKPLVIHRENNKLTVESTGDSLLLVERREDIRLTARERDVLSWVARGKTNAEIAQLLWLAPSTVRKHLENVYAKLGVSTRTAAVARFLGLIDAEAS
jgi:DNA-binding CsgD family transcriptional regulator